MPRGGGTASATKFKGAMKVPKMGKGPARKGSVKKRGPEQELKERRKKAEAQRIEAKKQKAAARLVEQQGKVTSIDPAAVSALSLESAVLSVSQSKASIVLLSKGTVSLKSQVTTRLVLPGSFNPLHRAHQGMMLAACTKVGCTRDDCLFELSISNADKGKIDIAQIHQRVKPFIDQALRLCITSRPTISQKADLFPQSAFVVGVDTAERVLDSKYYGGSEDSLVSAMEKLKQCGCSFIVVGRAEVDGSFRSLTDLAVPEKLQSMFVGLSEDEYRCDLSSTEIRNGTKI